MSENVNPNIISAGDLWSPAYIVSNPQYPIDNENTLPYGVAENIQVEAGTAGQTVLPFIVKPVVPISYAGNPVYDKLTDAINQLSNIDGTNPVDVDEKYSQYISYAIANGKSDVFHYENSIYSYKVTENKDYGSVDNKFLMKYEDITCRANTSKSSITLDEDTNIDEYISSIAKESNITSTVYFQSKDKFTGAFFFPDLDNISQILTSGTDRANVMIKPGESISIPLTFEYFIPDDDSDTSNSSSSTPSKISKKLIFVLKDSPMSSGKYYELEVTGNQSNNFADSIYTSIDNFTLEDSLTVD